MIAFAMSAVFISPLNAFSGAEVNKAAERYILSQLSKGLNTDLGERFSKRHNRIVEASFLRNLLRGYIPNLKISERGIEIKSAIFKGALSLNRGKIIYPVTFQYCTFLDEVDFSASIFVHSATFEDCIFNKSASFYKTEFLKEANFRSSKFSGYARFYKASFLGIADFSRAVFGYGSELENFTHFIGAQFLSKALFQETRVQ